MLLEQKSSKTESETQKQEEKKAKGSRVN